MSISAIVPVWNGRGLLERMLATLEAQTEPVSEVLAVDNGSTDGAPESARRRGARVIPMGSNAGFAPAVNRGIRESSGEWVAVLNTDVELAPDYLALLAAAAEQEGAWFASGRLLSGEARDGAAARMDGAFDLLCRGGAAWRAGSGRVFGSPFSARQAMWSAPWTAVLIRRELFERVGLLEERFGSFLEDVDFGLRCARGGLRGVYEPSAIAWHRGSASAGRWSAESVRLLARNQTWLLARHYPPALLRRHWWRIFVAHSLWAALAVRHGKGAAWVRGKWQAWRGFSEMRSGCEQWPAETLDELLRSAERDIYSAQRLAGFDFFWKMYFLLTGTGAS